jgi:hypothetical protein
MTNRFMMSVAAVALIAGTGFAYAQGTAAPSAGSTAQQSAPSSRDAAEPTKPSSGMKATQTEQKSPAAGKNERAEDNMQGQKSKSMSSDSDRSKSGSKEMKAEGRDSKTGTDSKMNADSKTGNMNAQTKGATDSKSQTTTGATDSKTTTTTGATDSKTTTTTGATDSKTTTGNAATSATAAPPAEKRTQIVSAIKSEKVEEVTNVNFNISVGATIPATVRFHRLPSRIVEIYPEWRGYEFILVHGRYIIVRPQTHEIVYIIEG